MISKLHLLTAFMFVAMCFCAAACGADPDPESKSQDLLDQVKANNEKLAQQKQATAQAQSQSAQITEDSMTVPDIEGTNDGKADAIAQIITQKADGLLLVTLGEVPLHGHLDNGEEYFGGHYRVFVTKSIHKLTPDEKALIDTLRDEIFELTTAHILSVDSTVTHMGVQTIYPDIWPAPFAPDSDFSGYDPEDPSNLCVADGRELLTIYRRFSDENYLQVAHCEKIFSVRESEAQYILELLTELTESR